MRDSSLTRAERDSKWRTKCTQIPKTIRVLYDLYQTLRESGADGNLLANVLRHLILSLSAAPLIGLAGLFVHWWNDPIVTMVYWIGAAGFVTVYVIQVLGEVFEAARQRPPNS